MNRNKLNHLFSKFLDERMAPKRCYTRLHTENIQEVKCHQKETCLWATLPILTYTTRPPFITLAVSKICNGEGSLSSIPFKLFRTICANSKPCISFNVIELRASEGISYWDGKVSGDFLISFQPLGGKMYYKGNNL